MPFSNKCSDQVEVIAEFLADREGLQGAARHDFLRQLREVFGFRATKPRRIAAVLAMLALLVAGFGLGYEWRLGPGAALPWLGSAAMGTGLAAAVARSGLQRRILNREFEWRAYCLVVRPTILLRSPGLLDRNLSIDRAGREKLSPGKGTMLLVSLWKHGTDLWVSAGIGWALGSTGAIVWRICGGFSAWLLGPPVLGALIAPPVWGIFRLTVFWCLQRTTGTSSEPNT